MATQRLIRETTSDVLSIWRPPKLRYSYPESILANTLLIMKDYLQ
jgi:hypothetical protein